MKTCFVISPIGKEGSEIRNNTNDLFDLIIEPALEKYDFKVIRADKSVSVSSITLEVIKMIQNSELCIIDLTGHNPNVFYECGRRHETSKPFILIKRKGEDIPFDLQDIRTVDYDLSDPRKTKASIDNLRKFVSEFEEIGYGTDSSIVSLSNIVNILSRIDRKIDALDISRGGTAEPSLSVQGGSPVRVFYDSLKVNDTKTATAALKKFMQISPDINLELDMASVLIEAYEPEGVPIVRKIIDNNFDNLHTTKLAIALGGLYKYYSAALEIQNEYTYLTDLLNKTLKKPNLDKSEEAALYNTLASIEWSMKKNIEALKYQERTVELAPSEPAYYYNLATIQELLDKKEDLIESLTWIITIYKNRDPKKDKIKLGHLEYAREIFGKLSQFDKITEIEDIISNASRFPENLDPGI